MPSRFCWAKLATLGSSTEGVDVLSKDHSFHPRYSDRHVPLGYSESSAGLPFKAAVSGSPGLLTGGRGRMLQNSENKSCLERFTL